MCFNIIILTPPPPPPPPPPQQIMVTLNPNELEHMEGPLTDQMLKQKYDEELERKKERAAGFYSI